MYEYVRLRTVLIGIAFIMFAAPCYIIFPSFVTNAMNKFTGGSSLSPMSYQIFSQLGIPPMQTIVMFVQYSFIGLIILGVGAIAFGIISKNIPKQTSLKLQIESSQRPNGKEDSNPEALHLLKERLAKGEITSSQYNDLKKVLEERI